jgi:hypothetical protein
VWWRIHTSPLEVVSLMISKSTPTQFFDFSESTRVAIADESTRYVWKAFWWRFLRHHRLSFLWIILSQQGLWALTNPRVTCGSGFVDDFWVGNDLVLVEFFWVHRACER